MTFLSALLGGRNGALSSVLALMLGIAGTVFMPKLLGFGESATLAKQLSDKAQELSACHNVIARWEADKQEAITREIAQATAANAHATRVLENSLTESKHNESILQRQIQQMQSEDDLVVSDVLRAVL